MSWRKHRPRLLPRSHPLARREMGRDVYLCTKCGEIFSVPESKPLASFEPRAVNAVCPMARPDPDGSEFWS